MGGGLEGFNRRFGQGDRSVQRRNVLWLGALVAGVAAIPLIEAARTVIAARAEERAWTITGHPCPLVDKPSSAATNHRGVQRHRYGDVSYARQFGAVSCAAFQEPGASWKRRVYRVCQFNNPGAVTVTTSLGAKTFETGPGRPMTVTVHDGRASCVLGGWFRR